MIELIAAITMLAAKPWHEPTQAEVVDGYATYYNPGVMERVAVSRGLIRAGGEYPDWLESRGLIGAVALNPAADLGRVVWLEGPQGIEGPFLSIDCAQRDHYADRLAQSRVVEVDWRTAQRWGMEGPVPVTVFFRDPTLPIMSMSEKEYALPY